jgi:hypothetical protein
VTHDSSRQKFRSGFPWLNPEKALIYLKNVSLFVSAVRIYLEENLNTFLRFCDLALYWTLLIKTEKEKIFWFSFHYFSFIVFNRNFTYIDRSRRVKFISVKIIIFWYHFTHNSVLKFVTISGGGRDVKNIYHFIKSLYFSWFSFNRASNDLFETILFLVSIV